MSFLAPPQGFQATSVTAAAFPLLGSNGTAAAPTYSFSSSGNSDNGLYLSADNIPAIAAAGAGILFIASNLVEQKNSTTAQEFRVYGTTTGPKYTSLKHTGTAGLIATNDTATISLGVSATAHVNWNGSELYPTTTNVYDVGHASFTWRTGYFGTSVVVGTAGWTISATAATGLTAQGNSRFAHGTSALATTATEGFLHVQSCAGTPTGVPASIPTGQIPMVFDTTGVKVWFYTGGAWKGVVVA